MSSLLERGWKFELQSLAEQIGLEELPKTDKELEEKLIKLDIREYGLRVIEDIPANSTALTKEIVLEVKKFKNVSVPESSARSAAFDHSGKATFKYTFTDGHKTITGLSIEGDTKLNRGTKVLFHKGCELDSGMLILNKKNFTVLGGGYSENRISGVEMTQTVRDAPKFKELINSKPGNKLKNDINRQQPSTQNESARQSNNDNNRKGDRSENERNEQFSREEKNNASRGKQQDNYTPKGSKKDSYSKNEKKSYNDDKNKIESGNEERKNQSNNATNSVLAGLIDGPRRMVYDEYEHPIKNTLTFSRSANLSNAQNKDDTQNSGNFSERSQRNNSRRQENDSSQRRENYSERSSGDNSRRNNYEESQNRGNYVQRNAGNNSKGQDNYKEDYEGGRGRNLDNQVDNISRNQDTSHNRGNGRSHGKNSIRNGYNSYNRENYSEGYSTNNSRREAYDDGYDGNTKYFERSYGNNSRRDDYGDEYDGNAERSYGNNSRRRDYGNSYDRGNYSNRNFGNNSRRQNYGGRYDRDSHQYGYQSNRHGCNEDLQITIQNEYSNDMGDYNDDRYDEKRGNRGGHRKDNRHRSNENYEDYREENYDRIQGGRGGRGGGHGNNRGGRGNNRGGNQNYYAQPQYLSNPPQYNPNSNCDFPLL